MVLTGSLYSVLIIMSKSLALANQVKNIPQITQNLNTDIMLLVRIIGMFILTKTTSVRCLSNIGVSEHSAMFQAGIHFMRTPHWNSYSKQIENINKTYFQLKMINSPKGNERNLLLSYTAVSHFLCYVLEQFECMPYYQPCEENHGPA